MQREIMTSIPFLSQPSAEALNTPEDLAVAQDLKRHTRRAPQRLRRHGRKHDRRLEEHHCIRGRGFRRSHLRNVQPDDHCERRRLRRLRGCLSLKGERRTVRFQRIEVSYADRKFRERHATFTGFTAQIIQHEIDHCEGIII